MMMSSTDGYVYDGTDNWYGHVSVVLPTYVSYINHPEYIQCAYCGSRNKDENSTCTQCGAPLYVRDNRVGEQTYVKYTLHEEPEGLIARVLSRLFG